MLEFSVDNIQGDSRLEFYRTLKTLGPDQQATRGALLFTRVFSDLLRRIHAIHEVQLNCGTQLSQDLDKLVLESYFQTGPNHLGEELVGRLDESTSSAFPWLPDFAQWLADGFNPTLPFASSYQVWSSTSGTRQVKLFGPARQSPPPAPLELVDLPPIMPWLAENKSRPAAIIAHYDVHGIAMLSLTKRCLNNQGIKDVDAALGFEWTGDISKLWKRAVPKTLLSEQEFSTVLLVDCSVHSRNPDYTMKAVQKLEEVPNTRLVIIDHHDDTRVMSADLVDSGATVALTDVYTCGLYHMRDAQATELMLLGALGDKLPEAYADANWPDLERLKLAADEFHRRTIHYSPTPKALKDAGIFPLQPLWDAMSNGERIEPALADRTLGPLESETAPELPESALCGSVVLVMQKPDQVGRMWYGLLERLMHRHGVSYAVAMRVLNGRRANFLLLTRWNAIHLPPVRNFVPEQYWPACLGHPAAVWADLELHSARQFIQQVVVNLNQFMQTPIDCTKQTDQLLQNVLNNSLPIPEASSD